MFGTTILKNNLMIPHKVKDTYTVIPGHPQIPKYGDVQVSYIKRYCICT